MLCRLICAAEQSADAGPDSVKQAVRPLTRRQRLSLPDGSGTRNQDIHESPGALLPVRAGRDTGDAD